jgi:hypothetical protein
VLLRGYLFSDMMEPFVYRVPPRRTHGILKDQFNPQRLRFALPPGILTHACKEPTQSEVKEPAKLHSSLIEILVSLRYTSSRQPFFSSM